MIARLEGILFEKNLESIIVDVRGVGYEVRVPLSTLVALPAPGEAVQILVHTHVREDSLSLYGFCTPTERHLFEKLISVSGVGPRLALSLLSGLSTGELADAILTGNTQPLSRVPGVGRKTAERLVVDLRDKLQAVPRATGASGDQAKGNAPDSTGEGALIADVRSALLNLGYSSREADRALEEVGKKSPPGRGTGQPSSQTFEDLFRDALRSASAMR